MSYGLATPIQNKDKQQRDQTSYTLVTELIDHDTYVLDYPGRSGEEDIDHNERHNDRETEVSNGLRVATNSIEDSHKTTHTTPPYVLKRSQDTTANKGDV
jgi:hypothetical protein